jgi:hypothetical protein
MCASSHLIWVQSQIAVIKAVPKIGFVYELAAGAAHERNNNTSMALGYVVDTSRWPMPLCLTTSVRESTRLNVDQSSVYSSSIHIESSLTTWRWLSGRRQQPLTAALRPRTLHRLVD